MPNAALCSSHPHRNENPRCPASTTSPAAPLWRPLLNRYGGDIVSSQLGRHFLVATTREDSCEEKRDRGNGCLAEIVSFRMRRKTRHQFAARTRLFSSVFRGSKTEK